MSITGVANLSALEEDATPIGKDRTETDPDFMMTRAKGKDRIADNPLDTYACLDSNEYTTPWRRRPGGKQRGGTARAWIKSSSLNTDELNTMWAGPVMGGEARDSVPAWTRR